MRSHFRCAAMAKAKFANIVGKMERYSEAVDLLKNPGDYVVVHRGVPRSVVMACPDACGEILTLNLDRRTGKAWRIYGDPNRISMYPSIWKDSGCRAHFILWHGRILWCLAEAYERPHIEQSVVDQVLRRLTIHDFISYEELANQAGLNPWDALWACDVLVRNRQAVRGPQSTFKASTGKSLLHAKKV